MGQALETVKAFCRDFGAGDFTAVSARFSADCKTVLPAGTMNVKEHEMFARAFKAALADGHMEIVKAVESGDEVFVEGRFKGTHTGDLVTPQGTIPASRKKLDLRYADYFRVQGGRIVEHHVFWDQVDMMSQLGAAPLR
jgi:ketosteroid isomerase-like protein